MSIRIDRDLVDAAKAAGARASRSAAQQLDHWARIGRQLDQAPTATRGAIDAVLDGRMPYDDAPATTQAVVRTEWRADIDEAIATLDLRPALRATGAPWPEADADGALTMRT